MVMLSFQDSVKLLNKYGIRHSKTHIVKSREEAGDIAEKLGFPAVMKLASTRIVHKTDVGAVRVGLADRQAVESSFEHMSAKFPGEPVIVQHLIKGMQLIIGAKRDPQFGPVILFGIGGIFVELMRDVAMRVAPLSERDALEMMHEIKAARFLEGVRGRKPVSFGKLAGMLLGVSRLMIGQPRIKELDLNPVIADDKEAVVVDVRIIS